VRSIKFVLRLLLSLGMSGLFIWLSLRKAPLRQVGQAIVDCDKGPLAFYLLLNLGIYLLRTVRWGILLEPLGHVGFRRLNSASAVGLMLLIVLPLRLGEFARPLLIARPPEGGGPTLRRSGALASIVVERIVDGIFVGLLGVLALRSLGARASGEYAQFARNASLLVAAGFLSLCLVLVAAFFLRRQALAFASRLLTPISPRLAKKLTSMLDAFIAALHLGSGWKVGAFFGLTGIYWLASAWGLQTMAGAFGMRLSSLESAALLAVQVVGAMVPAGPGMVGTLQFFTQMGLSLFVPGALGSGPAGVSAAAFANTVWLMQFGQQVLLGLVFVGLGHVSLRGLFGASAADPADDAGEAAVPAEESAAG
jgi:hypothetical protein